MIESNAASAFEALADQLERQAAALAEAQRQSAELTRADDPVRWRSADLLWPTFGKG
jgi:hypothetical protein